MTRLERLAAALAVVTTRAPVAMASTPLELRNPLNGRGLGVSRSARMASNARRKVERMKGRTLALRLTPSPLPDITSWPRVVVLTRISPKPFDDDNNAAALKSVRDGMAEAWGIDDADERVTWVCDWRKGKAHVVEAALWAIPERTPIPERTEDVCRCRNEYETCAVCVAEFGRQQRALDAKRTPAPSQPEIDPSDYERPRRDAWADIRSDSRKPVITPAYIRAKGGL